MDSQAPSEPHVKWGPWKGDVHVRGCTTWSCSDLFVADADILNLIRVATNMENLEYPAISLNMENSEFCTASGKNCKKVVLVHMFV